LFLFIKNYNKEIDTPPLLLKEPGKSNGEDLPVIEDFVQKQEFSNKALVCHRCRKIITSQDQAIEVDGEHQHTFFNPAGIVYELLCFKNAPGCLIYGDPTVEFTWFKSHTWQFCLCGGCLTHLGWFFQSDSASFYGLIKQNLLSS
jgi:hypothetical protein